MNKKLIIKIIIFIILMAFFYSIYFLYNQKNDNIYISPTTILFSEKSGSGPCMTGAICNQSVDLYYSGRLVMSGKIVDERQLNQSVVNDILDVIKSTDIMKKNCSTTQQVQDFGATYYINYKNLNKQIIYPGCQKELGEIKSIINSSIK